LDWIAQVSDPPVGGGITAAGAATTAAGAGAAVAADAPAESPRPLIAVTTAARPAARQTVIRTLADCCQGA
jgi:hypothetical protein